MWSLAHRGGAKSSASTHPKCSTVGGGGSQEHRPAPVDADQATMTAVGSGGTRQARCRSAESTFDATHHHPAWGAARSTPINGLFEHEWESESGLNASFADLVTVWQVACSSTFFRPARSRAGIRSVRREFSVPAAREVALGASGRVARQPSGEWCRFE